MQFKQALCKARGISLAFSLIVTLGLAGCGGGGTGNQDSPGSKTITGTAAAGAPVVGYVSVQDSSANPQPVRTNIAIAADGTYTVDVTGLTPPFAFKASGNIGGKQVTLYSVATSGDIGNTINITPFTDLIVRNAAGTLANTLIDSYISSGSYANLTTAQINAERDKLTAQLTPVLQAAGLSTTIDLLRAVFNADGTGLDRFMDLVKVDASVPTAVTITNILDANSADSLTINPQTGVLTGPSTLAGTGITPATTATPVDLIRQTLTSFEGYFATGLPNPANAGLTALFAPSFMDNGQDSNAFLTNITMYQSLIGMKFGNKGLVVDSIDLANGIAQVSFVAVTASGMPIEPKGVGHWQLKKVGNAWLLDGNQRLANVWVATTAQRTLCGAGWPGCAPTNSTGLNLFIENTAMQPIGAAVVTGPGLPQAGVTLVAIPNSTLLQMTCQGCNTVYSMTDVEINALGTNGVYTVDLWSNAATPVLMGTYTEIVAARPVLNTELATLAFPSIGGVVNLWNGYTSGTLPLTWSIPAGLRGDAMGVDTWQWASGEHQSVHSAVFGKSSGSANLVISAPTTGAWDQGNYFVRAYDVNGGEYFTSYQ